MDNSSTSFVEGYISARLWLVIHTASFLILLIPFVSNGQSDLNQFYEFDNLHSKELIKGILRDDNGYLWLATDDGIMIYDGQEVLLFNDLDSKYAKEFLQTKDGEVLVVHDSGMELVEVLGDSAYVKSINGIDGHVPFGFPKSIFEDRDSTIWIGETNAVVHFKNGKSKRYFLGDDYHSISYHHSFSFTEDAFGHLWVAPFKGSLLSFNEKEDLFKPILIGNELTEVSGIASIKGDHLIVSGKEGLVLLKIDSKRDILRVETIEGPENISDIEVVGNSMVYISTWDSGLYEWDFDAGVNQIVRRDDVTIEDIVQISFNNRLQELWIAGGESIGVLKGTKIKTIKSTFGKRIESLSFAKDDGYYFSSGESIYYSQFDNSKVLQQELYSSETFFSRILHDGNSLWVGDFFGSVFRYDLSTQSSDIKVDQLSSTISFVSIDSQNNKWFTGNIHGLIKIDHGGNFKLYPDLNATVLVRESKNGSIIGVSNSPDRLLSSYDAKSDEFKPLSISLDSVNMEGLTVNDFQFDENENIWLATNKGLLFVNKGEGGYSKVSSKELIGFEGEPIRSIAISEKCVWLGLPEGLVLYQQDESLLFNKDGGLPSSILKERGLKYGPEGELYIYTAKGLAKINENVVEFRKSKKPVAKSITVNGNRIGQMTDFNLLFPYNSSVSLDFLSLSFPNTKLQYQTRVLGYDNQWSNPNSNTSLSLLGFSEGVYTIQVRAKKGGYLWSEPYNLAFEIDKPWFKEWWVYLFTAFCVAVIILIAIQIHNRNLILQKRKLREIIEERTKEIQNQKNEIIDQQEKLIRQKEELLLKNQAVHHSEQARDKADLNFLHLKEKQLKDQIDHKNKQITTHALNILQKNESLKELREEINKILKKPEKSMITELKKTLKLIDGSFKLDKDWEDFKLYFEQIYTGFYAKLKVNFPEITNLEMRHCALIRLNLPTAECASILGISPDSVKVTRSRLRKKLGLAPNQSLTEFIMSL